jgi:hypothetical protein
MIVQHMKPQFSAWLASREATTKAIGSVKSNQEEVTVIAAILMPS